MIPVAHRSRRAKANDPFCLDSSDSSGADSEDSDDGHAHADSLPRLELFVATFERPTPPDVRFSFLNTSSELWAHSSFLMSASPYFKDLFGSGFAEATLSQAAAPVAASDPLGKRKRVDEDENGGFDDSDDEHDESTPPPKVVASPPPPYPFRSVVVTAAAYSTYRAVLAYIYTSQINFRPLRSAKEPPNSQYGTSPNSIYRLADFLGMPTLKALALEELRGCTTIANVAEELLGDVSKAYLENTPPSLAECQPAQLTFTGDTPPFFISIIPGGNTAGAALETLPTQTAAGSATWLGTSVSLQIKDGSGQLNFAQAVTIQPGTSTSCLGTNTSGNSTSVASSRAVASTSALDPWNFNCISSVELNFGGRTIWFGKERDDHRFCRNPILLPLGLVSVQFQHCSSICR
ncbi:hypothetical protein RQP46_010147 [Phenoliferia psychrophenolica]